MKNDIEVRKYMKEREKGASRELAAARAGMSLTTARRYERAGKFPSQMKRPHDWQTRENPFQEDWSWVVEQLERDDAIQGSTLFALLCEKYPGKYRPTQVRTLQRHIARWRALHGGEKEVIFEQFHLPGERAQTDFTHMEDLHVTIQGEPFDHLLYHCVLTYSNVEAIRICFGETFEALAEGIEHALWQFGGVPQQHRTDHLGAAIHPLPKEEQETFKAQYLGLMRHYGMQPTVNNTGVAHENGDVEQSHFRFQTAVDQALRIRGSRDFASRAAYEQFLDRLVRQRNETRRSKFEQEREVLRPLPVKPLSPCREIRTTVSRFSTIQLLAKTYSVPSRLIGTPVVARMHAETVEVYVGTHRVLTMPRVQGAKTVAINYRHVIHSLLRKPGAFAHYRYRDELFPTTAFRQAYDRMQQHAPQRADKEYLNILQLAALTSESEVELALELLMENRQSPRLAHVRDLVRAVPPPQLVPVVVDLTPYDALLPSQRPLAVKYG